MKPRKLLSHPNTLVWSTYVIALIVWLIFSWQATDHIINSRTNSILREGVTAIRQQANNIAVNINHDFEYMRGIPEVVAREDDVLNALTRWGTDTHFIRLNAEQRKIIWSKDTQLKALNSHLSLIATSLGADVVYILNSSGDCIAASNADKPSSFVGINYATREYFQDALAGKNGQQYAIGKTSNLPGLFFSQPINVKGHLAGVAVAKINLLTLSHWVNQADAFITDKYGVVILARESKFTMRALHGTDIAALPKEARIMRYKQENFSVLAINSWPEHFGESLQRFDDENQPMILTDKKLETSEMNIHVFKRLPQIKEMDQERLKLFFWSGFSGAVVLLLICVRIIFLRNRKRNEGRLLDILNLSPIGVRIAVTQGRKVVFYNPRYADLIKNPETIGDDPKKYYVQPQVYEEVLDELEHGKDIINRQIELRIHDGSTVWVLASYMPIKYLGEKAVLGWFYDISKLKQAEESLDLARRNAEASHEELRALHESNMDDLAVANNIMAHIMRSEGLRDTKIRYFQRPALQFSGDVIAAARDDNGDLRLMLADVTGHGLQAALFLLPLSRVFYSMVKRGFMTSDIAREMNKTMREIAVTGRFIAAAVAHITRHDSSIEIWNGGIPAAYYVQKDGELHKFRSQHLPMGVVNNDAFDDATEIFHGLPGALLLCSDGLTEAENASGEPFGEDRFETILRSSPPEALFDNILSSFETHLAGSAAHDDLSIVIAQCGN